MKVQSVITGIIAEFDPFHNGHEYLIQEAFTQTHADYIIVILSGSFTQRGSIAIYDTSTRAHMALLGGADAVFEMPSAFSTASAEDFAMYGVSLLGSLGVRYIAFGCEDTNANELYALADIMEQESDDYIGALKLYLKQGMSYAAASHRALLYDLKASGLPEDSVMRTSDIISKPNNILGLEYCRSIIRLASPIRPIAIERQGVSHDSDVPHGIYKSASAIRHDIHAHTLAYDAQGITSHSLEIPSIQKYVPEDIYEIIINSHPMFADDLVYSTTRHIHRLVSSSTRLDVYADVSSDLADRIANTQGFYSDMESYILSLKTKQYTYARVSRALTHIMLGITKEKMNLYKSGRYSPYARLLGFRRESLELLSVLKENTSVPIISKMADASDILSDDASAYSLLMDEVFASDMYRSYYYEKYGIELASIYTQQMVII